MNFFIKVCWVSVCLVVIFINLVSGLKCFECTLSEPTCANPTYNNVSIVDCSESVFTIRPEKLQFRLQGLREDDRNFQCLTTIERNSENRLYTRRCALKTEKNICEESSTNDNESRYEQCSLCEQDYCNSSSSLSLNLNYLLMICLIFVYK